MKKRLTLSLFAIILTFFGLIQFGNGDSKSISTSSIQSLSQLSGTSYDIAWLSQMIEHHAGAIAMARLCMANCTDLEIKQAAARILSEQIREAEAMIGWLRTTYRTEPDPIQRQQMKAEMEPMMKGINHHATTPPNEARSESGDRSFLECMIPHHELAALMGRNALTRATGIELRRFAKTQGDLQSWEVILYKGWLKTKQI